MDSDIRKMTRKDIDGVYQVETACFRSPWSRNSLQGELRNNIAHYHVMEADGKIVGYAGMWVIFEEAHITNIAVLEPYRGHGRATRILLSMMESAVLLGATCMTLEVREHNLAAQRLYAKLGFVRKGFRPRYYTDTGEGAIILWNLDLKQTLEQNGKEKKNHEPV